VQQDCDSVLIVFHGIRARIIPIPQVSVIPASLGGFGVFGLAAITFLLANPLLPVELGVELPGLGEKLVLG